MSKGEPETLRGDAYRRLVESVGDFAIIAMDLDGAIVVWNPGATRIFGYDADEVVGRPGHILFTEEDQAAGVPDRELETATREGRVADVRWHSRRDGSRFWASGVVTAVRDEDGTLTGFVKVAQDRTFEKRAADQLRDSEYRLELAQHAGRIGTFDWNVVTDQVAWTAGLEELFGLPPGGFDGTFDHWRSMTHPDDAGPCADSIRAALAEGRDEWEAEYRIRRCDTGETRWIDARTRVFYGESGEPMRMVGVNVDVTERVLYEAALRDRARAASLVGEIEASLARGSDIPTMLSACASTLLSHFDAALVRIWLLEDGSVLQLAASAGLETDLDGEQATIRVGERDVGGVADSMQPILTNRLVDEPVLDDREWSWREGLVAFAGQPLTAMGELVGVVGLFARHALPDETLGVLATVGRRLAVGVRRRQADEEREGLLAREQDARAVAERRWRESARLAKAARELARALETQDVLATICAAARDLVRADGAAFVVRDGDDVEYVEENTAEPFWKGRRFPVATCLSGHALVERSAIIVDDALDDPRVDRELYASTFVRGAALVPVRSHDPFGVIGVYWAEPHGATERELNLLAALADLADIALTNARLYGEMKAARDDAESANRIKDEFLATISHELRTPLNAMLGWTKMLRAGELDGASSQRALETIERNAYAQARLIEDLLDVSRIISGKVRLDVGAVDPTSFVEAAIDAQLPAAEAKGVRVERALELGLGRIWGDAARLQQIVWNLLSNAIKFTPMGGRVRIGIRRSEQRLEITVSDTGKGIDTAFLPHVFDRFRQADATTTRRHRGLGLGLAIVRHLTELHGGTVEASSDGEGHGATFVVNLPLHASSESRSAVDGSVHHSGDEVRLDGVRVLVVDDEEDAREMLRVALGRHGADVATAASAEDATAELDRTPPHVLVSDIGMPDVDGYELIRSIRQRSAERGGTIPAVALTAYARSEDRSRALSAGYDRHVPKPVDSAELAEIVYGLIGRAS